MGGSYECKPIPSSAADRHDVTCGTGTAGKKAEANHTDAALFAPGVARARSCRCRRQLRLGRWLCARAEKPPTRIAGSTQAPARTLTISVANTRRRASDQNCSQRLNPGGKKL